MTDRPIIFSAPMVRALLEGRKSQTRRIAKVRRGLTVQELVDGGLIEPDPHIPSGQRHQATREMLSPVRYAVGDRLYVRESIIHAPPELGFDQTHFPHGTVGYLADPEGEWLDRARAAGAKTRTAIHMPRWASRLTLLVDDVRVERLQEISEADALAEGIHRFSPPLSPLVLHHHTLPEHRNVGWVWPSGAFRDLWNSLHGPTAWDENPWVVALTFRVVHGNIDLASDHG